MNHSKSSHYHTLDGLRGVAAGAVVLGHLGGPLSPIPVSFHYLAVDLFFVLSGFVLAHAYEGKILGGLKTSTFMMIRLRRLYPLYIAGTLLGVLQIFATIGATVPVASLLSSTFLSILILPTFFSVTPEPWLFPLNVPAWSLFMELATNLGLVLIWKRLTNRMLSGLLVVLGITQLALILRHGGASFGIVGDEFLAGLLRASFGLLLGVGLSRLPKNSVRSSQTAWLLLGALCITFLPIGLNSASLRDVLFSFVLLPALVLLASRIEPGRVGAKTFAVLGRLSYPLYVTHFPLMFLILGTLKHIHPPLIGSAIGGTISFIGCVIFAWLADRWFDQPVRRLLNERRKRQELVGNGEIVV